MNSVVEGAVIGYTSLSPSTNKTLALATDSSFEIDLLFRIVIIKSGPGEYLGIVENVSTEPNEAMSKRREKRKDAYPVVLAIRNLLYRKSGGTPAPVRNVPRPRAQVSLASEADLARFFPGRPSTTHASLGCLRDTTYRLPLDATVLSFSNTGILAGIGHGKSHVAAQLVLQLHLAGRRMVVVDPTGEWPSLMTGQAEGQGTKLRSSLRPSVLRYSASIGGVHGREKFLDRAVKEFRSGRITIIDASLLTHRGLAEEKIQERCALAYDLQQRLMVEATRAYDTTKSPYAYNGCILLEEAHEFVPASPDFEIQGKLDTLFSISTKEYRKYGLGLMFIDQSLQAVYRELQVQTYILGSPATPGDLEFLKTRLGDDVADAVQR
ncbi:MAG: hypothetical protein ACRD6W_07820, partial [Nitrososphaerales archaeon]